jgi:transcriptional regulator with XRE-family HTH domain
MLYNESMTQPENPRPGDSQSRADHVQYPSRAITRPAIGVLVDPERMAAARKSAMLERAELSDLSKILELRKIAAASGAAYGDEWDLPELRRAVASAGIVLTGKRIGISRDEIAKLETGGRKRPKITTLRKFLDTINYARAHRDKPPIEVEDLQVPGEVLIPPSRGPDPDPDPEQWDAMMEEAEQRNRVEDYQQASNEIRDGADQEAAG